MRCAVVGGGAWGTALAHVLATNGHAVRLWAREPEVAESINARHENAMFLPGARLHGGVSATGDMETAIADAEVVVYAAPSKHLRSVVRLGRAHVGRDVILAVATKGIEEG